MICDKCGKSNILEATECSYCSAKMPKKTNCGGFADILSYEEVKTSQSIVGQDYNNVEGISEQDMQKLLKKSDNIIKSTNKNAFFAFIAVVLGVLILISSIVIGIATINSVKGYKDETMKQITETQKELEEYKVKIDTIISEIEKTDENKQTIQSTIQSMIGQNDNSQALETSAPPMDSEDNVTN